jgi:hypothetical protein
MALGGRPRPRVGAPCFFELSFPKNVFFSLSESLGLGLALADVGDRGEEFNSLDFKRCT